MSSYHGYTRRIEIELISDSLKKIGRPFIGHLISQRGDPDHVGLKTDGHPRL